MFTQVYKNIFKPIAFKLNPDFVHNQFTTIGEFLGRFRLTRKLTALIFLYKGDDISKVVDGVRYKTPILLSAGFDPDGRLVEILPSLSFGGEEIGSVTNYPTKGNDGQHYFRLKKNESIIVRKGLKNSGVKELVKNLKQKKKDMVWGISLARTNSKELSKLADGVEDYYNSLKHLIANNMGDYYTINISCPNAYTGEDFANLENLGKLLEKLSTLKPNKPVYVKMPINLEWNKFREMVKMVLDYGFQGIVMGNLNKNYDMLKYRDEAPKEFKGGLSGKPCFDLSNELIRKTREEFGKNITIIGVGGIFSGQDAIEKFKAGADLVELITGVIFEGPMLIKNICKEYSKYIKEIS